MVYFWQRQSRPAQLTTATAPAISLQSSTTSPSPPLPATSSPTTVISHGSQSGNHFPKGRSRHTNPGLAALNGNNHTNNSGGGQNNSNNSSSSLNKSQHVTSSYLLDKLSEYSRRKQETDKRRVAERELDNLNLKIDKLLSKMGESEVDNQGRLKLEEECVVCLAAPATMQTFPCGHKVVCRKCLIKTIQVAVSQRCLPLRCVICRDRILRLHHTMHYQSSSSSVTPLTPSVLPSTLTPPLSQNSRFAPSSITPTSASSLFSIITGSRSQSSSPRLLSPPGNNGQVSHSPSSPTNPDNVQKLSHLTHGAIEDEFLRYAPSDVEAFVNSHNDALNLHRAEPARANINPNQKSVPKQSHSLFNGRRNETSSHGFMHAQSVKIHPEATSQPSSFMESAETSSAAPAPHGQSHASQKQISASKFIAKFLPKTNRRKYNWFRHE